MNRSADDGSVAHAAAEESIGRQLHDIVVPQLFALATGLTALGRTEDRGAAQRLTEDLGHTAAQALTDLRTISRGHRLNDGGNLQRIAPRMRVATQTVAHLSDCEVDMVVHGDAEISPGLDDDLTAVVWEALSNAIRHGKATHVDIVLQAIGGSLRVVVLDDGRWLEPRDEHSTGLAGLAARAEHQGGRLRVERGDHGTRLVWEVPLVTSAPGTPPE